jgi:hypothetical protein
VARLLLRGEYYDSVSPGALFEDDYERLLLANGKALYPSWHLGKFKCVVESEYGRAKADLALVDKRYRNWWVVEVERAIHPLSHVEPQVRSLAAGRYDHRHASVIKDGLPNLDLDSLREMVLGQQPRVLVLVNAPCPDWSAPLHQLGAKLGIIEIFRSPRNIDVLRVNGEHPDEIGNTLSLCRVDLLMPRSLIVSSPAALPIRSGGRVEIVFEGGVSEWKRVDSAACVWLMPVRRSPLPPDVEQYHLHEDDTGRLFLMALRKR